LFTTEDGVEVCEGDTVFVLSTKSLMFIKWEVPNRFYGDAMDRSLLYFSTEEAANKYILENKPILSVQEVMNWLHSYFQNPILAYNVLKYEAKQKLSQ